MASSLADAIKKCDEWVINALAFLPPVETLRYAATSRACLSFVQNSNYLWMFYAAGLLGKQKVSDHIVKNLIALLCAPSPQELCRCFYRSSGAPSRIIGWYRVVPQGHVLKQGGVICVQEHSLKKIEMLMIGANGNVITVYDIRYSAALRKLVCCQPGNNGDEVYQLLFADVDDGMQLSIIDENDGEPLAEGQHPEMTLRPFKATAELLTIDDPVETRTAQFRKMLSVVSAVGSIAGLFTAPYGSHGLELLHVRLVESSMQLSRWGHISSSHRRGMNNSNSTLAAAYDSGSDGDDDNIATGSASITMMVDDEFSDEDSDDGDGDDNNDAEFFDAQEGEASNALSNTASHTVSSISSTVAGMIDPDEEMGADSGDRPGGRIFFLEGLKITGDPNVPAGQLSFRVNVTQPIDFSSWIADDPRPIVFYGGDGEVLAMFMDERQAIVRAAYRGFGQINRKPEDWRPEWVGLTLVQYTSVHAHGAFSIVWDDDGDYFRHLMDFRSFRAPEMCRQSPTFTT